MNKKHIFLVLSLFFLFLCTATVVSAQGAEQPKTNQFSFGGGALIALSDDTVSVSPGLQLSWINPSLFTNFGLGVHLGIFMATGEISALGATLIAGPTWTIFDNGVFRIPITLGLHADYFLSVQNGISLWVWNAGAGVVPDFVWQFGKKWYAYGRVQMACNFGEFEFYITPGLGMGLSW